MNREITSRLVDEIIRLGALGASLSAAMVAPNAIQALDKPLRKLFARLDQHEQVREVQRVIRYMKQKGLLAGSYEHGLQLTRKAKERLIRNELETLSVTPQKTWDKRWRIILYDIPERQKSARDALGTQLLRIGCFQLQKSTWITPFPCRDDIVKICTHYDIDTYVTYFEALNLDNEKALLSRFKRRYPSTRF